MIHSCSIRFKSIAVSWFLLFNASLLVAKEPTHASPIIEGGQMIVEIAPEVLAGDRLIVKIRLENKGTAAIGLWSRDEFLDYKFSVLGADKKPVNKTAFGTRMAEDNGGGKYEEFELKPGEKLEESLKLSQLFDLSMPGEYTFRISRGGSVGAGVRPKCVEWEINEIVFTVNMPK